MQENNKEEPVKEEQEVTKSALSFERPVYCEDCKAYIARIILKQDNVDYCLAYALCHECSVARHKHAQEVMQARKEEIRQRGGLL
jgi:hypothetical protein